MAIIIFTFRHFHWNGQAGCVIRLAEELQKRGHAIKFICGKNSKISKKLKQKSLSILGFIDFNKEYKSKEFYSELKKLNKLLTNTTYDLIQTNGPPDMRMIAHNFDFDQTKAKVIRVIHSSVKIPSTKLNKQIFNQFLSAIVIEYKNGPKELLPKLIPDKKDWNQKVFISHGTFDTQRLENHRTNPLNNTTSGPRTITFIGRLEKDKGLIYLLKAIAILSKQRTDFKVHLVGTGSQEIALKKITNKIKLQRIIKFLGFREDVGKILAQTYFTVLPSIDCDASSTAIKESLYLRVPAIATNIGGIKEIIQNKKNGYIISPKNPKALATKMNQLLSDPELIKKMKTHCEKSVQKFTPKSQANIIEEVYKSLATKPSSPKIFELTPTPKFPSIIVIELTDLCNLQCKMCWLHGLNGTMKKRLLEKEIPSKGLIKFLEKARNPNTYVRFTGGEPLIKPGLFEILKYLKTNKIRVGRIATNATLITPKMAKKLVNSNIERLTISIDGDQKIHDKIRGKGNFTKTIQGIKNIQKARQAAKSQKPEIEIVCTISKLNYLAIPKVVKIGAKLKAKTIFQLLNWMNKNQAKRHEKYLRQQFNTTDKTASAFALDFQTINPTRFANAIKNARKTAEKNNIKIIFRQPTKDQNIIKWYTNQNKIQEMKPICTVPFSTIRVDSKGIISPCRYIRINVGTISNPIKAWNSSKFIKFRKDLLTEKTPEICKRCNCFG